MSSIYIKLSIIFNIAVTALLPLQLHAKIFPQHLNEGDKVALVAPAAQVDDIIIQSAVSTLENLGLEVKLSENLGNTWRNYFSATDEQRLSDLCSMFLDDSIHAVIAIRGGWGSSRLLNHYCPSGVTLSDVISNNPKIFLGYSDITSLLNIIYAQTGLITYHAPMPLHLFSNDTQQFLKDTLFSDTKVLYKQYSNDENYPLHIITPGTSQGEIIGGNLTVLTTILGNDYLPESFWKNKILFLEDIGESTYSIDRMLNQLQLAGIFEQLNGFIFGTCNNCPQTADITIEALLQDYVGDLNIPAVMGVMVGHNYDTTHKYYMDNDKEKNDPIPLGEEIHTFTLPIGVNIALDINQEDGYITIEYLESAVS